VDQHNNLDQNLDVAFFNLNVSAEVCPSDSCYAEVERDSLHKI
jgi:hypothetical protein